MLAPRLPANRGWCDPKRLPRGPNGRALCRQCKTEVPKGCRTFCSDLCVKAWRLARDPGYQRQRVEERDRGVCALCSLDTHAFRRLVVLPILHAVAYSDTRAHALGAIVGPSRFPGFKVRPEVRRAGALLRSLLMAGWPRNITERLTLWDMDHIVPVAEGGGSCGMENLRTLCMRCHRAQTAALARRRSRGAR